MLAFLRLGCENGGMQGSNESSMELLDAGVVVGHLIPPGSVYEFLGEHRRRLFPDDMFADLFPSRRGRPSVAGDVVATVMVLQSLEGLSDRDAVDALRTDLKWKVACGVSRHARPHSEWPARHHQGLQAPRLRPAGGTGRPRRRSGHGWITPPRRRCGFRLQATGCRGACGAGLSGP